MVVLIYTPSTKEKIEIYMRESHISRCLLGAKFDYSSLSNDVHGGGMAVQRN
jgi:hypothetical protein